MTPTSRHFPAEPRFSARRTSFQLRSLLQRPQHPGFHRQVATRRVLALLLLAAAFLTALGSRHEEVLVAAKEIPAGHTIAADDVRSARWPAGIAPQPRPSKDDIVGAITAHGLVPGDVISPLDILSPHLTHAFVSTNTSAGESQPGNMVPLTLADPALAPLLQHGDVVSIITTEENTTEPRVIAAGGTVISAISDSQAQGRIQVLIALPEHDAHTVAATALHSPLAVVITGPRAGVAN